MKNNNIPYVSAKVHSENCPTHLNTVCFANNPYQQQDALLNNPNFRNESYGNSSDFRTFAPERGVNLTEGNTERELPYIPTTQEERDERRKLLNHTKCHVLRQVEILQVFFSELFDKFPKIRSLNYAIGNAYKSIQIIRKGVSTAYETDKEERRAKIRHLKKARNEIGALTSTVNVLYEVSQRDYHKNLISAKQMRHIIDETADIRSKISGWIKTLEKAVEPQSCKTNKNG